jgi:hypothetical protein
MLGNSWLAEQLEASQEELSYAELVSCNISFIRRTVFAKTAVKQAY